MGIIGGGQLAMFLAEAAKTLGLSPVIFAEGLDVPACRASDLIITGSLRDPAALYKFFSKLQKVIFENEWIDVELMEQASRKGISFLPSPQVMSRLQDKLCQKAEMARLGISSAPHAVLDTEGSLKTGITRLLDMFGGNCVFKWSRNGYDGKGLFFSESGMQSLLPLEDFCRKGLELGASVYAEKSVAFDKELALVAVRSSNGDFIYYPLVISIQDRGTCHWILGPANRYGVTPQLEQQAVGYARRLAEELDFVGTFAMEFFMTSKGDLLVNEVAPRVHNSGHFSLDASSTSQFENHLRAVLGLPLTMPHTRPYFVMLNLLGPDHLILEDLQNYCPPPWYYGKVHWYYKKSLKPRRKMGHVTAYADNVKSSDNIFQQLQSYEKEWKKNLEEMYERKNDTRCDRYGEPK